MPDLLSRSVHPQDVLEALAGHQLVDGYRLVMDLERSQGSWIVDARDGRRFLDFYTFFATAPLGHNHPRLRDPEFMAQLGRVAVHKPANSDIYTEAFAQWVLTFATHCAPPGLTRFFWIDGGTLAVENALKAAFDWKARKNRAAGRPAKGSQIIHFREAFHGRSGYALSLTNTADWRKFGYFPKFAWPRLPNPKIHFPLDAAETERVATSEARALAALDAAVERDPDDIAALIMEPIQGEGGDNHFRPSFFKALRERADRHGFLLIFDEVQTGLGTTGKWWAHEHFGVEPDLIAFGKKTQVCGVAAGPRMDEVASVFRVPSRINSTWGGSLVDMVRATRIVETIVEEELLANATREGHHLLDGLQTLQTEHPELVSNARGLGLFCAMDLPSQALRQALIAKAHDRDMLILAAGRRGIRFRPALNVTREDLDLGLSILADCLADLQRNR